MTERKIKLVALDLDGTTFTSKKKITENTRNAIIETIEQGVIVIPATGRPKSTLPEAFTSIPGVRYALTSNGGAVWDLQKDEIVADAFFPYETACRVIDALISLDALVEIYHSGICYADQKGYDAVLDNTFKNMPEWFREYVKVSRTPVKDLREWVYSGKLKIEKFLVSFDDLDLRARVLKSMAQMDGINVSYGTDFNMEINSAEGTKGGCLLKLGEHLGILPEEIMAVGDAGNDLSMLQAAGLSVVMANGDPQLKAIADEETLSNDEDGVAYALRKFVLQNDQ